MDSAERRIVELDSRLNVQERALFGWRDDFGVRHEGVIDKIELALTAALGRLDRISAFFDGLKHGGKTAAVWTFRGMVTLAVTIAGGSWWWITHHLAIKISGQ